MWIWSDYYSCTITISPLTIHEFLGLSLPIDNQFEFPWWLQFVNFWRLTSIIYLLSEENWLGLSSFTIGMSKTQFHKVCYNMLHLCYSLFSNNLHDINGWCLWFYFLDQLFQCSNYISNEYFSHICRDFIGSGYFKSFQL